MADLGRQDSDAKRLVDAFLRDAPAEIGSIATDAIRKHMLKKAPEVLAAIYPSGIPSQEAFGNPAVSSDAPSEKDPAASSDDERRQAYEQLIEADVAEQFGQDTATAIRRIMKNRAMLEAHVVAHSSSTAELTTGPRSASPPPPPPLPPKGSPTDNGGMSDAERITALETKWETVIPSLVTKADLKDAVHDLAKWIVGSAIAIAVAGVTVMTFVLNNAVPKPQPAPAAIIQSAPPMVLQPQIVIPPAAPASSAAR